MVTTLQEFQYLASHDYITSSDPLYRAIINKGPEVIPELKEIAGSPNEHWGYIAFLMLAQIGDRSIIPFLMTHIDAQDKWVQTHVVWGLDHLLELGTFHGDDALEIKQPVIDTYKEWFEENKSGF